MTNEAEIFAGQANVVSATRYKYGGWINAIICREMTQEEAYQIFMSRGTCARCDVYFPKHEKTFRQLSGENIVLGFCSSDCENEFVQGMKAIHDVPKFTTQ